MISKIDMDNGNFPIAKDALRALAKTKISGAHRAMIDVIWINTYGQLVIWLNSYGERKTEARIAQKEFTEETWMEKDFISKRLNELADWGIIIRDRNTKPTTYSFNENVSEWDPKIFRSRR